MRPEIVCDNQSRTLASNLVEGAIEGRTSVGRQQNLWLKDVLNAVGWVLSQHPAERCAC